MVDGASLVCLSQIPMPFHGGTYCTTEYMQGGTYA